MNLLKGSYHIFQMFEGIAEGLQLEELGNRVSGMFFYVISVLCHLPLQGQPEG